MEQCILCQLKTNKRCSQCGGYCACGVCPVCQRPALTQPFGGMWVRLPDVIGVTPVLQEHDSRATIPVPTVPLANI